MVRQTSSNDGFYLHESGGARILIPNELSVVQPFPELYAKAKKRLDSIIVTITTCRRQLSLAETSFHQLPRGVPSVIEVKIIRNGAITSPFPGKELIWEVVVIENPAPSHTVLQILELDTAKGAFAVIRAQGEGLFEKMEPGWKRTIDSLSWDPAEGEFLKFDGDEFILRKRHKKKIARKPTSLPKLPAGLRYLQPVVDELLSLRPEEIHEDVDLPDVDRLLQRRTHGLSRDKAIEKLGRDCNALKAWIEQDRPNRDNAAFLYGFIEYSALLKRLNK